MHKFLGCIVFLSIACAQTVESSTPMTTMPSDPPVQHDVPPVAGMEPTIVRNTLSIRFDGPASQRVPIGTNGASFYRFALIARRDVEVRFPAFTLASLVSSNGRLGCLVSGDGLPNFSNFRVVTLANSVVVNGPTGLWPTAGSYRQTLGLSSKTFRLDAGQEVSFLVQGDVRRGDSTCPFVGQSYVVTAGQNGHFFNPGDVRILDEDRDALPEEITHNIEIPGHPVTITRPELYVSLSSAVASTTYVRNNPNARAVAITLTASSASDIRVDRLPPIGVGNIGEGRRRDDFGHTVLSCRLLDDSNSLIGRVQSPDAHGLLDYRELGYVVHRGTTRVLMVECATDSVVSQRRSGDQFAIGFAGAEGIEAVDNDNLRAHITVDNALIRQLTTPSVEMTVMNSGTLSIESVPLRPTWPIEEDTGDAWFVAAEYRLQTSDEDGLTDRVAVAWNDPSITGCIQQIGLFVNGVMRGTTIVASSATSADIVMDAEHRLLTTSTASRVQVAVQFARAENGTLCPIGSQLRLGLALGLTSGEWDNNYLTVANWRTVGSISGVLMYAAGTITPGSLFTLNGVRR